MTDTIIRSDGNRMGDNIQQCFILGGENIEWEGNCNACYSFGSINCTFRNVNYVTLLNCHNYTALRSNLLVIHNIEITESSAHDILVQYIMNAGAGIVPDLHGDTYAHIAYEDQERLAVIRGDSRNEDLIPLMLFSTIEELRTSNPPEWSVDNVYQRNDIIQHNGHYWIYENHMPNIEPTAYSIEHPWKLICSYQNNLLIGKGFPVSITSSPIENPMIVPIEFIEPNAIPVADPNADPVADPVADPNAISVAIPNVHIIREPDGSLNFDRISSVPDNLSIGDLMGLMGINVVEEPAVPVATDETLAAVPIDHLAACKICYEYKINTIVKKCMHSYCCSNCIKLQNKCTMCKGPVSWSYIYLDIE
jgi:hypothetical protein